MDFQFLPEDFDGKLSHLIEECGEVIAAIGKIQRFGIDNANPKLPTDQQETNREQLRRELKDLKHAISRVIPELWNDT